ncbi:cytochrome p450 domain-containing protein [Hirsutella rhossiliensis]|uniref:Cytochrome p450 domain-containing protein n=1 Tax=Hirsutella rhossiliensis TaxID=111463 RepID=A0A9P8MXA6_9HYPO|nr:cytochrome p450 domain-containing protein [Hirsutella rhossiliensis]KAH0964013.1 cytochrome p450 domain-containing protein [Hirsutella rhossiliensis]
MSISFYQVISASDEESTIRRFLAALVTVAFVSYGLYQWLLPKPVPGIACNPEAIQSLLGDAPAMIREVGVTGEFRVWCAKQPWILLADFRESRDILMRRREFDKSSFLSDGMACMGSFHGIYLTGDKFKSNRQLIQDLMTTSFLHKNVGPAVYNKGLKLMKLFELKMKVAHGRPFSVKKDFEYTSLDVMLAFAFGKNWVHTALGPQVDLLSKLGAMDAKLDALDQPVNFPTVPLVEFLNSVYEAPEIVEKTINAILPKLQTWWWSRQSWYKRIFDEKERVMKEQVAIGVKNYRSGHVETGVEHMLMRGAARAEKEGRGPDFESKVFRDEMFGNIVGGHHTTSGAMMWLTKYLTDIPQVQNKLRSVLHQTLSTAKAEKRLFTFEEIRHAKLPYLDAVIEEMLRINAVPVTREALCDTTILGCPIQKGTQVFFMSNGPGFLSPSFPIDESKRSETSRSAKLNATWNETQDLTRFDPDRWLVRKNDGEGLLADDVDFDGGAGPQLVFGAGPRTCWGRRLAYMEMRTAMAMLVWNFRLEKTPPALSAYAGLEGIARVPQQCYVRLSKM